MFQYRCQNVRWLSYWSSDRLASLAPVNCSLALMRSGEVRTAPRQDANGNLIPNYGGEGQRGQFWSGLLPPTPEGREGKVRLVRSGFFPAAPESPKILSGQSAGNTSRVVAHIEVLGGAETHLR